MAKNRICSVDGCGKGGKLVRGLCGRHYQAFRRNGCPTRRKRRQKGQAAAYLSEVVLVYRGDDCLIWPFTTTPSGYAVIWMGGRLRLVSRVACSEIYGEPPTPEHEAAHSCGKGHLGCVNIRHLSWKTSAENSADAIMHGTWNHGEKVPQSKLTEEQVQEIRASHGVVGQADLAGMYGVSKGTIQDIQYRRTWRWLE